MVVEFQEGKRNRPRVAQRKNCRPGLTVEIANAACAEVAGSLALPILIAALASASVRSNAPEPGSSSVPFIADDYPRALRLARSMHRPLFIDAWAPWCHTCRSMRAFVFTDPALA